MVLAKNIEFWGVIDVGSCFTETDIIWSDIA